MVFLLFLFCMEPFHFPGKGLICPEFPEKDQGINTGNAHNGKNNPGHSSECAEEVADQVKFKKPMSPQLIAPMMISIRAVMSSQFLSMSIPPFAKRHDIIIIE